MPFGTQQAFFSRVELVAPVDDWRASRCVARCPALFVFFADAVARREQRFGAVVPPHGLARGCTALAQGCNVVLSLRTLELVVARVAVVKELLKFVTTQCASSSAGKKRGSRWPHRVRYRMYLYLIPR